MLECYTVNKRNYIYPNSENYMFVKITDDRKSRVHLLFFVLVGIESCLIFLGDILGGS